MKIKVIFTGGNVSDKTADGQSYTLLRGFEGGDVKFDTAEPYSISGAELCSEHMIKLARCIEREAEGCDGVIVALGADTIAYVSAFLAYIFGDSMPIALVASGTPLSGCHSNGRHNFAAAMQYIKSGYKGVAVPWYYQGAAVIHHGARLFRQRAYDVMLRSIGDEVLFYMGPGALSGSWRENSGSGRLGSLLEKSDEEMLSGLGRVMYVIAVPSYRYPRLLEDTSAVLIESYHSGTMCEDADFEEFMSYTKSAGVPVFITGGTPDRETAKKLRELGAVALPKATPDAMYIKLCLAAAADGDIAETMLENCAGEMIPDPNFMQ